VGIEIEEAMKNADRAGSEAVNARSMHAIFPFDTATIDASRKYARIVINGAMRIGDNLGELIRTRPLLTTITAFAIGYLTSYKLPLSLRASAARPTMTGGYITGKVSSNLLGK
jgi:hypothetical protein